MDTSKVLKEEVIDGNGPEQEDKCDIFKDGRLCHVKTELHHEPCDCPQEVLKVGEGKQQKGIITKNIQEVQQKMSWMPDDEELALEGNTMITNMLLRKFQKKAVLLLELFSPPWVGPELDKRARQLGVEGELGTIAMDLTSGWNALSQHGVKQMWQTIHEFEPCVIGMSPPCRFYSALQNLSQAFMNSEEGQKLLREAQRMLHICLQVAKLQTAKGLGCYLEHPFSARSWKTRDILLNMRLIGTRLIRLDQCVFDAKDPVNQPYLRKPTDFAMNCEGAEEQIQRKCSGVHQHQVVMGATKTVDGKSVARSLLSQQYPISMCRALARITEMQPSVQQAMTRTRRMRAYEEVHALSEESRAQGESWKTIAMRIHKNLQHPDPNTLATVLKLGKANPELLQAAKEIHKECSNCAATTRPTMNSPSKITTPISYGFNEVIGIYLFFVEDWKQDIPGRFKSQRNEMLPMLSIACFGTQHQIVVPVTDRSSLTLRRAYRQHWTRHGRPRLLITDNEKGIVRGVLRERCSAEGTKVKPTPGESPHVNGRTERLGGIWKDAYYRAKMSVIVSSENDFDELVDSINTAVGERRSHIRVLGRMKPLPEGSRQDTDNPMSLETISRVQAQDHTLCRAMQYRMAARTAYAEADIISHWRRAMNGRSLGQKELAGGDRIYYWRGEGGQRSVGAHWHGPATVVSNQAGKITVIHRDQVSRCSQSQVRRATRLELEAEMFIPSEYTIGGLAKTNFNKVVDLTNAAVPPEDGVIPELFKTVLQPAEAKDEPMRVNPTGMPKTYAPPQLSGPEPKEAPDEPKYEASEQGGEEQVPPPKHQWL